MTSIGGHPGFSPQPSSGQCGGVQKRHLLFLGLMSLEEFHGIQQKHPSWPLHKLQQHQIFLDFKKKS